MKNRGQLYIFGEVLFDCFPNGAEVLGGAPFNVAWHLQALGDQPRFISRIGNDECGKRILRAMEVWGMGTADVQVDEVYPTGRVEVTITNDEPNYDIVTDSAYDFISAEQLSEPVMDGILYHGTLCLRNLIARDTLSRIRRNKSLKVFLDVNLRTPWWQQDDVSEWLKNADWVKMNEAELLLLGATATDIHQQMAELQTTYALEQLIVTRGDQGALVRTVDGEFHSLRPEKVEHLVDTVGAGDAFSAVYIHGLRAGWPIATTLENAQKFASKVIGIRGATTIDAAFYQDFISLLPLNSD